MHSRSTCSLEILDLFSHGASAAQHDLVIMLLARPDEGDFCCWNAPLLGRACRTVRGTPSCQAICLDACHSDNLRHPVIPTGAEESFWLEVAYVGISP